MKITLNKMKWNKKTVGGAFLLLLILLIFCSKTVYSYNLPQVYAVKPQNARLSKFEMSAGQAAWAEMEHIYAAVGGRVSELMVKEGDQVEAGQALFFMEFDRDDAERQLKEIAASRAKLQIDIQNIQLELNQIDRAEGNAGYELTTLEREIDEAKKALSDAEMLYELGEMSRRDLEAAQEALQSLYSKKEVTLSNQQTDGETLKLQLQAKQLELSSLSLQEEPYRKALADYEDYAVVTAPVSGFLLFLDVQKGERISENTLMASIGAGQEFLVECTVSLDNNFVLPGDLCELSNTTHVFEGTVTRVNPGDMEKTVTISLVAEGVTAGETFDIVFEKESDTTYTLVPNGALNQDNDGYFLYQVKQRDGMLGKEFYLERVNVYIGDSDNENTVIIKGITFFEPLVLTSNKPVDAGDVVSLTNVGDFFAE